MEVVLIHGLARTGLSMLPLKWFLQRSGFSTHVFNYPSRSQGIEAHAGELLAFLRSRLGGVKDLSFVTHSLGSIVLLEAINKDPAVIGNVRAVMLGPPCCGSKIAGVLSKSALFNKIFGPCLAQLRPRAVREYRGSMEIGVIAGNMPLLGRLAPFVSYPNDGIVSVQETELRGAKDFTQVRALHAILMCYPAVLKNTRNFLLHGSFCRAVSNE